MKLFWSDLRKLYVFIWRTKEERLLCRKCRGSKSVVNRSTCTLGEGEGGGGGGAEGRGVGEGVRVRVRVRVGLGLGLGLGARS